VKESQNWTAYNTASCEEKRRFGALLADLCRGIPQPEQTMGRPRLPLSDMTFASVFKVYCGFSSRRFTTDLRDAFVAGHIDSTPHFNSVSNYMAKPELTDILKELVVLSSLPLKAVETDFVVDSSGFSSGRYVRWVDKRWGKNKETDYRDWFKAHLVCGVRTKIVTGVDISGWTMHDGYFLPPPRGVRWQRTFVRQCIFDDVYKPHSFEEVAALVSPEVAARLDPSKSYGVWWYNRRRAKRTRVLESRSSERRYKERVRYTDKPRDEWIAVPVPDAGVPREIVDRARASIENNERCSSAGRRFWELSGGIFRCPECRRALVATTARKGLKEARRLLFYYQCATRRQTGKHACSFSRSVNAHKAEAVVWEAVSSLLTDPASLRQDLQAMIEREHKTYGHPDAEARAWAEKLVELERRRDRYQEMFAAEAMTLDELRAKLEVVEETRETAKRELAALAGRRERLEEMERDRDLILESYAALAPEALDALSPEERRKVYVILNLTVEPLADGGLKMSGAFGEEPVWEDVRTSTR
jgi:recombinase-like zinc beta ribbon protein